MMHSRQSPGGTDERHENQNVDSELQREVVPPRSINCQLLAASKKERIDYITSPGGKKLNKRYWSEPYALCNSSLICTEAPSLGMDQSTMLR